MGASRPTPCAAFGGAHDDGRWSRDRRCAGDVNGPTAGDGSLRPGKRARCEQQSAEGNATGKQRPPRPRQVRSAMHLHRTIVRSQGAFDVCAIVTDNAGATAEVSSFHFTGGC